MRRVNGVRSALSCFNSFILFVQHMSPICPDGLFGALLVLGYCLKSKYIALPHMTGGQRSSGGRTWGGTASPPICFMDLAGREASGGAASPSTWDHRRLFISKH